MRSWIIIPLIFEASRSSGTQDSAEKLVDRLADRLEKPLGDASNLDHATLAKSLPGKSSATPTARFLPAADPILSARFPAFHGTSSIAPLRGTARPALRSPLAVIAAAADKAAAEGKKNTPGLTMTSNAGTVLPEMPPGETREFFRELRKSDQYLKFSKTQMEGAMDELKRTSGSNLLRQIREAGFRYTVGDVTFVLAESYGFCWGVERSIAMAHEAKNHFPDKSIWVTNEIIHNPEVNQKLADLGMGFIEKTKDGGKDFSVVGDGDVVILPAFGATVYEMAFLKEKHAHIVDTTCPWVNNVWNSVEKNKAKGYTSIIHGSYNHEETQATKSFADHYLVVKNMEEAEIVADYILHGGDRDAFLERFKGRMSVGFDPDKHLTKVGVANQTTMLKGETEIIQRLLERTMIRKFGPEEINDHFLVFSTICDATDERQGAMYKLFGKAYKPPESNLLRDLEAAQGDSALLSDKRRRGFSSAEMEAGSRGAAGASADSRSPLDMVLVVGGFNSANTAHLLEIVETEGIPGYHIDGFGRIGAPGDDLSESGRISNEIEVKPLSTKPADAVQGKGLVKKQGFLPDGPLVIGVTSGASTPDSNVEQCLKKILAIKGLKAPPA